MKNNYGTRSDMPFDFVYTDGDSDDKDKDKDAGSKSDQAVTIKVDGEDKVFKAEDVQSLLDQQASATQKTQQVSAILKACAKFDLEPEAFVSQAEGAFSVISDMIEKGMVDQQGNILEKKLGDKDINFNLDDKDKDKSLPMDKVAAVVAKALEPITKKLGVLEHDQTQLTRLRIADSIKSSFKNLEDKDISQVLATAQADRTKTLMQHAEDLSKNKDEEYTILKGKIAKELGVDLKEYEANLLLEQDAKGGIGAMFKGKKFSFKKGGGDSLTPMQAMREYMDRVD